MFAMFQMMFAIITPALIVGAIAERTKFLGWCVSSCSVGHHRVQTRSRTGSGTSTVVVPKGGARLRRGDGCSRAGGRFRVGSDSDSAQAEGLRHGRNASAQHRLTLIGAGLLMWAGSASTPDRRSPSARISCSLRAVAVMAFAATAIAGSAATGSGCWPSGLVTKKPTALGVASGMVAVLVVITPCAGHVSPGSALVIGLIGGLVCFLAVQAKQVIKYDDSLDVVGVHGVGGALGPCSSGSSRFVPWWEAWTSFMLQLQGVAFAGAYAFVCTIVLGILVHKTIGLTVSEDVQEEGLDYAEHGEIRVPLV